MLYSLISSGASFRDILIQLLLTFPVVVFSLSVHEYAHGWVAMKCGDRMIKLISLCPLVGRLNLLRAGPWQEIWLFKRVATIRMLWLQ